jgi:hypothetical protein
MINWKRFGRKRSCPNFKLHPSSSVNDLIFVANTRCVFLVVGIGFRLQRITKVISNYVYCIHANVALFVLLHVIASLICC